MGTYSIGGGTTGGCGGSGVAAWTRLSLGTLRLDDGDEHLAPRVLAMVISEKVTGGARGLAQMEGSDGELLWFGSSLVPI